MADYLYLFRGGDNPTASPEEMQKHMQKWGAWIGALKEKGIFKGGEPLEKGGKVVRGKQKSITDGPFAEAKDLVGGYVMVSVKSIEEAVEHSKGCPILEVDGAVEIRPVMHMNM